MAVHDTARATSRVVRGSAHDSASILATRFWARDRAFSVAIGVIGFHVATWSTVARYGSSAAGGCNVVTEMPWHDRVPKQAGRIGSRQRLAVSRPRFCVATGLGLGLGLDDQGRDRGSLVRQGSYRSYVAT